MDMYLLAISRSDQKELNHFNYFEKNGKQLKLENGNFPKIEKSGFNAIFFLFQLLVIFFKMIEMA